MKKNFKVFYKLKYCYFLCLKWVGLILRMHTRFSARVIRGDYVQIGGVELGSHFLRILFKKKNAKRREKLHSNRKIYLDFCLAFVLIIKNSTKIGG